MTATEDPEQEAVLEANERHLLVIAPPGTGKTALAARLAGRLAADLAPHERVLLLTFSNQARGQLGGELDKRVPGDLGRAVVVTNYHQFFWSAIRSYRSALGLPFDASIGSQSRRDALLRGADQAAFDRLTECQRETVAELRFPEFRGDVAEDESLARLLAAVDEDNARGHLTFGDLGGLFWRLMAEYPTVRHAYVDRYPVAIADEHQDSSALQDAVARLFGSRRLIVLADPMQLIHAWRGADEQRLRQHAAECDRQFELKTPHRWAEDVGTGIWLLSVRGRLDGATPDCHLPRNVRIVRTDPSHGQNAMLAATRFAALAALRSGAKSVAILASKNEQVAAIRSYLSRNGLHPRQLGISHELEALAQLAEQLPSLSGKPLVERALSMLFGLCPTIQANVQTQIQQRLEPNSSRKAGASEFVRKVLASIDPIYEDGPLAFFSGLTGAIEVARNGQHQFPGEDQVRLFASVAATGGSLEDQLKALRSRLALLSHQAPGVARGIMVMTVHQAKGREFDGIILFDASASSFPPNVDRMRVFYVAVTRARRSWDLIAPNGRETSYLRALGDRA